MSMKKKPVESKASPCITVRIPRETVERAMSRAPIGIEKPLRLIQILVQGFADGEIQIAEGGVPRMLGRLVDSGLNIIYTGSETLGPE